MNLLHVTPRYFPAQGGAERYWQEISERAARAQHAVQIITTNARDIQLFWEAGRAAIAEAEGAHNGVKIRRYPVHRFYHTNLGYRGIRRALAEMSDVGAPLSILKAVAKLAPHCPELDASFRALSAQPAQYDAVVGINIVYESLLVSAFDYARATNTPFVLYPFTHLGEPGNRAIERFYTMRHQIYLAAQSDAVFISTPGEGEYLFGRGVAREKMVLLGSGIAPEKILGGSGARARAKFNIQEPLILFVGTVSTDKGATQTVQAMAELARRGVAAKLVMVGAPLQEFEKFFAAQPAELRARCVLSGFISEEDKKDLLDACEMLVLPSRTDLFPTVYLEAWLYGKPVIGAHAGGIPDVIEDGGDGVLVPFGDAKLLADAMENLLRHPARARALGENGKPKVYAHYTWDILYRRIITVLQCVAERKNFHELSYAAARADATIR